MLPVLLAGCCCSVLRAHLLAWVQGLSQAATPGLALLESKALLPPDLQRGLAPWRKKT